MRQARRLVPFAVASLGLHGLLLAVTAAGPATVTTGDWPPLRVALAAAAAPAAVPVSAQRAPAQRPTSRSKPPTRAEPARRPASRAAPPPANRAPAATPNPEPPTDTAAQPAAPPAAEPRRTAPNRVGASPEAVLTLIRTDFARHFTYPRLARLRGWEGDVLLGFTVDGSGHITDIRIARSSGHPTLDAAARGALERVRRVTAPPLTPAELELPVAYRLEG
jgi:protein TonB